MLAMRIVGLCGVRARDRKRIKFICVCELSHSSTMYPSRVRSNPWLWQKASGPSNEEETEVDASAVEKKDSQDGTKTETATEPMATEKGSRASAAENEEQSLPSGLDEGEEGSGRKASSASSWNSENKPGGSQRNEPWQKQSWDSKNRTHEENDRERQNRFCLGIEWGATVAFQP